MPPNIVRFSADPTKSPRVIKVDEIPAGACRRRTTLYWWWVAEDLSQGISVRDNRYNEPGVFVSYDEQKKTTHQTLFLWLAMAPVARQKIYLEPVQIERDDW